MAKPKKTKGKKSSKVRAGTARKVSDNQVSANFEGVEGRTRRRVRIPEGSYLAKVHEAKADTAKSGNDMVVWVFEIVEGKYEGARFWDRTVLLPQALWRFRANLEALGIKVKDSAMTVPLDRLAGRTCGIEIVDGEYDGKTVSEINDVFPEALLEEDEEDEEEDEFEEEEDDEEEDFEDDEDDDEEEEDEEEDELDEDEIRALGIKELRAYAREQGVYKPKMKKAEILDALLGDEEEDEEDEEEEWDDEVDLDEDEL